MMKKIVFYIILFAILITACNRKPVPASSEAVVHILASLADSEGATKNPVIGPAFPNYNEAESVPDGRGTYGIFVCKHGTTNTAHKSNSWNIAAKHDDVTDPGHPWYYYYVSNLSSGEVASSGYDHITLTARNDEATADLYAYAPYKQSAYDADPTAIPYSISSRMYNQSDLMYAAENNTSTNKNLSPTSESPLSATFTFKHAFALLVFNFKLKNDSSTSPFSTGTSYLLDSISVSLNGVETTAKLYKSGTFNAITGTFNSDGVGVRSLKVNQIQAHYDTPSYINSASSYTTGCLMLVPTEVADNELVFNFKVAGQSLQPFYLQADHLTCYTNDMHTETIDGSAGHLLGGYRYDFYFTLDNYLYLDGFSVGEWTTPVDPLGEQEI